MKEKEYKFWLVGSHLPTCEQRRVVSVSSPGPVETAAAQAIRKAKRKYGGRVDDWDWTFEDPDYCEIDSNGNLVVNLGKLNKHLRG